MCLSYCTLDSKINVCSYLSGSQPLHAQGTAGAHVKERKQPLLCYLSLLVFLVEDGCINLEPSISSGVHYAKEFCIVRIISGSKTCEEGEEGEEERRVR